MKLGGMKRYPGDGGGGVMYYDGGFSRINYKVINLDKNLYFYILLNPVQRYLFFTLYDNKPVTALPVKDETMMMP